MDHPIAIRLILHWEGSSLGLLSQLPGGANGFQIGGGPNYYLIAADYLFHKLSNVDDRNSSMIADANDVTSS